MTQQESEKLYILDAVLDFATGESRALPEPQEVQYRDMSWSPVGWLPDGTKLLAQLIPLGAAHSSVWVISMLGGPAREIHEGGFAGSVSPGGSQIACEPKSDLSASATFLEP